MALATNPALGTLPVTTWVLGGAIATGLDGQQLDVGAGSAGIVEQLGGAHGGAADAGRQQALPVMLAQDGIDELGLAAREFADKGQQDAVKPQGLERCCQAVIHVAVIQPLIVEPAAIARDLPRDCLLPGSKSLDLP